jgi:hypothetical protein
MMITRQQMMKRRDEDDDDDENNDVFEDAEMTLWCITMSTVGRVTLSHGEGKILHRCKTN